MFDITFDTLRKTEQFLNTLDVRLRDQRRLWTDYVMPFTHSEIDDIFDSGGRGRWADLDPLYAARKAVTHPGRGILEREGTYRDAATTAGHANSLVEVGPTELVLGVSGLGYPAFHEAGAGDLPARPVYDLIVAGERFEERTAQLAEKWSSEEIAAAERGGIS